MSKEYEQQILDWEQDIVMAEKTIQATCEAYVGNPDGAGRMYVNWNDVKHQILFKAESIRRRQQRDQKI